MAVAVAVAVTALAPSAGCARSRTLSFRVRYDLTASYARKYRSVRDQWTRRVVIVRDWDTALDARVTLVVPDVREAYIQMVGGMRALSDADRIAFAQQQRDDGLQFIELWVAMETSRWDWNDLSSSRSLWTVTLADEAGRGVQPVERSQMAPKSAELEQLFAEVGAFTQVWRLRFPTAFPDGSPVLGGGGTLTARIAGPLGHGDARWERR